MRQKLDRNYRWPKPSQFLELSAAPQPRPPNVYCCLSSSFWTLLEIPENPLKDVRYRCTLQPISNSLSLRDEGRPGVSAGRHSIFLRKGPLPQLQLVPSGGTFSLIS